MLNIFKKKNTINFLILIVSLILPLYFTYAETMQSSKYKIISDTVNTGGQDSSSANYKLRDTAGEAATGESDSANYKMHAGFWQMQKSYISISSPTDLALTPIGGIAGEASEGTISWNVTTDNLAGYSMSINALTSPALKSDEDSFSDYTPAGSDPDYNFSINPTTSAFGFSPEGTDANARFKDNGISCNAGSGETINRCWDGLSTSPKEAFQRSSNNQPSGTMVTVRFRAESGSSHIQKSGSYAAPIVVTAITL